MLENILKILQQIQLEAAATVEQLSEVEKRDVLLSKKEVIDKSSRIYSVAEGRARGYSASLESVPAEKYFPHEFKLFINETSDIFRRLEEVIIRARKDPVSAIGIEPNPRLVRDLESILEMSDSAKMATMLDQMLRRTRSTIKEDTVGKEFFSRIKEVEMLSRGSDPNTRNWGAYATLPSTNGVGMNLGYKIGVGQAGSEGVGKNHYSNIVHELTHAWESFTREKHLLKNPETLKTIKEDPNLAGIAITKLSADYFKDNEILSDVHSAIERAKPEIEEYVKARLVANGREPEVAQQRWDEYWSQPTEILARGVESAAGGRAWESQSADFQAAILRFMNSFPKELTDFINGPLKISTSDQHQFNIDRFRKLRYDDDLSLLTSKTVPVYSTPMGSPTSEGVQKLRDELDKLTKEWRTNEEAIKDLQSIRKSKGIESPDELELGLIQKSKEIKTRFDAMNRALAESVTDLKKTSENSKLAAQESGKVAENYRLFTQEQADGLQLEIQMLESRKKQLNNELRSRDISDEERKLKSEELSYVREEIKAKSTGLKQARLALSRKEDSEVVKPLTYFDRDRYPKTNEFLDKFAVDSQDKERILSEIQQRLRRAIRGTEVFAEPIVSEKDNPNLEGYNASRWRMIEEVSKGMGYNLNHEDVKNRGKAAFVSASLEPEDFNISEMSVTELQDELKTAFALKSEGDTVTLSDEQLNRKIVAIQSQIEKKQKELQKEAEKYTRTKKTADKRRSTRVESKVEKARLASAESFLNSVEQAKLYNQTVSKEVEIERPVEQVAAPVEQAAVPTKAKEAAKKKTAKVVKDATDGVTKKVEDAIEKVGEQINAGISEIPEQTPAIEQPIKEKKKRVAKAKEPVKVEDRDAELEKLEAQLDNLYAKLEDDTLSDKKINQIRSDIDRLENRKNEIATKETSQKEPVFPDYSLEQLKNERDRLLDLTLNKNTDPDVVAKANEYIKEITAQIDSMLKSTKASAKDASAVAVAEKEVAENTKESAKATKQKAAADKQGFKTWLTDKYNIKGGSPPPSKPPSGGAGVTLPPPPNDPNLVEQARLNAAEHFLKAAESADKYNKNLSTLSNTVDQYSERIKKLFEIVRAQIPQNPGETDTDYALKINEEVLKRIREEEKKEKIKQGTRNRAEARQEVAKEQKGFITSIPQVASLSPEGLQNLTKILDVQIDVTGKADAKYAELGKTIEFTHKRASAGFTEVTKTILDSTGAVEAQTNAYIKQGKVLTGHQYERQINPNLRNIEEMFPNLRGNIGEENFAGLEGILSRAGDFGPLGDQVVRTENSVRKLNNEWFEFTRTVTTSNGLVEDSVAYLHSSGKAFDSVGFNAEKARLAIESTTAKQLEGLSKGPNYQGVLDYFAKRGVPIGGEGVTTRITQQPQKHGGDVVLIDASKADDSIGGMRKVSIAVDQYGGILSRVNRRTMDFTDAIINNTKEIFRWSIGVSLIYGSMYRLQAAFQQTIENESKLADITVTLGSAQRDTNEIFADASKVARETGENITDVLETYSMAYTAVGGVAEPMERTIAANKLLNDATILNKLSSLDAAEAIDTLSGALRQTAGANETAIGSFSRGRDILDKWVKLSTKANVDLGALATAFSVTAESALSSGMSIEELNAVIATLSEKIGGLGGKETGNAVRALIGGVYQDQAAKALNQYGIAVTDVEGKMRNFMDISRDIYMLYKQGLISEDELAKIAYTLGGGVRRGQQYLAFLTDYQRIQENINVQSGAAGSAQLALSQKMDTTKTSITQLNSAFMGLTQTLATDGGLLDVFRMLLSVGTGIADTFNKVSKVLGSLTIPATILTLLGAWRMLGGTPAQRQMSSFANTLGTTVGVGAINSMELMSGLAQRVGFSGISNKTINTVGTKIADRVTKYAPGMLAGSYPAMARFGEGSVAGGVADLAGSFIGSVVGSLAGPAGSIIGGVIGGFIADSFIAKALAHKTDFAELFPEPYKEPETPPEVAENKQEEFINRLYKEVGWGFAEIGKIRASSWSKSWKSLETDTEVRKQKAREREDWEQGAWAFDLLKNENKEVYDELKAIADALNESIIKEVPQTETTFYTSRLDVAETYKSEILKAFEKESASLMDRMLSEEIKPSTYQQQVDLLTPGRGLSSVTGAYTVLNTEIAKTVLLEENLKVTLEDIINIYSRATSESSEAITTRVTAIVDAMNKLDSVANKADTTLVPFKDPYTGKDEEISVKDYKDYYEDIIEENVRQIGNMNTVIQKEITKSSGEIALGSLLPTFDMSEMAKTVQDAQKIWDRAVQNERAKWKIQLDLGEISQEEYDNLIDRADLEKTMVLMGNLAASFIGKGLIDSGEIQKAFEQLGNEGAVALSGVPFEFMDYSPEQIRSVANSPQYYAIEAAIRNAGGKTNEENKVVVSEKNPNNPFLMKKDWAIVQYLLGRILDVEEKQLEGVYNLPGGASFYVPFDAYKMGYANEGGGGGLDIPTVEANSAATEANTQMLANVVTALENFGIQISEKGVPPKPGELGYDVVEKIAMDEKAKQFQQWKGDTVVPSDFSITLAGMPELQKSIVERIEQEFGWMSPEYMKTIKDLGSVRPGGTVDWEQVLKTELNKEKNPQLYPEAKTPEIETPEIETQGLSKKPAEDVWHMFRDQEANTDVYMEEYYKRHGIKNEDEGSSNVLNKIFQTIDKIVTGITQGILDILSPPGGNKINKGIGYDPDAAIVGAGFERFPRVGESSEESMMESILSSINSNIQTMVDILRTGQGQNVYKGTVPELGNTGNPQMAGASPKIDIQIQPQPIKVNFNTTTSLVVDGRTLAAVIMPYLYSAMVRSENVAGGSTRRSTFV